MKEGNNVLSYWYCSCQCDEAQDQPEPTLPLCPWLTENTPRPSSGFLCRSGADCPESQMSSDGLRSDSCLCILDVHRHIPRSVERDEVTFAAGSSKHPLVSSLCVSTFLVSCPAVTMDLCRLLVCLPGQTSRCAWHSSFIDGLFFNCSGRVLSFPALTLADPRGGPSDWGPTFNQHTGSTAVDLYRLWHTKNNLQGCFSLLVSLCSLSACTPSVLTPSSDYRWVRGL